MSGTSQELGRELNKVMGHAPDDERQSVLERLDHIEAVYTSKVAGDPCLLLEVQRRVAEAKFFDLFSYHLPPDTAQVAEYYGRIKRLGFTDLERECTIGIAAARHYLRCDKPRSAVSILRHLDDKLAEIPKKQDLPLYKGIKRTVEKLLDKD